MPPFRIRNSRWIPTMLRTEFLLPFHSVEYGTLNYLHNVIIRIFAWECTSVKTRGNSLAAGINTGICYRELSSETLTVLRTWLQRDRFNPRVQPMQDGVIPSPTTDRRNRRTIYKTFVYNYMLGSKQTI